MNAKEIEMFPVEWLDAIKILGIDISYFEIEEITKRYCMGYDDKWIYIHSLEYVKGFNQEADQGLLYELEDYVVGDTLEAVRFELAYKFEYKGKEYGIFYDYDSKLLEPLIEIKNPTISDIKRHIIQ